VEPFRFVYGTLGFRGNHFENRCVNMSEVATRRGHSGGMQGMQDCSAVGLYCVTITWQQICKGSFCITVAGVLLHEAFERRRLGR